MVCWPGSGAKSSAELIVYDNEALVEQINTIDPLALLQAQLTCVTQAPPHTGNATREAFSQTPAAYRAMLRRNMASLHENVNDGTAELNADMAAESVEVDSNGSTAKGRAAFVKLVSSLDAGQGAFPDILFHDGYVLANGHLGARGYVCQATQEVDYAGLIADGSKSVRMRGMLFLKFDDDGLVVKATHVSDESVFGTQLNSRGPFSYR